MKISLVKCDLCGADKNGASSTFEFITEIARQKGDPAFNVVVKAWPMNPESDMCESCLRDVFTVYVARRLKRVDGAAVGANPETPPAADLLARLSAFASTVLTMDTSEFNNELLSFLKRIDVLADAYGIRVRGQLVMDNDQKPNFVID